MTLAARVAAGLAALAAAVGALPAQEAPDGAPASPDGAVIAVTAPPAAGPAHWRIEAPQGVVHVWRPAGYDPERAGVVVYVHGYFTDVDRAWDEQRLAEQFAASGRNALFIVPSAPAKFPDEVPWPSLPALLDAALSGTGQPLPKGLLVVAGHSGAFRTIVPWLASPPRIGTLVLIDAMYRYEREFGDWLRAGTRRAPRRMLLVGGETTAHCAAFVRHRRGVVRRAALPAELGPAEKKATVLYFEPGIEHMELVTGGRVIPALLRWSGLPAVASPSPR